ncbi:MAG: hypothetical protein L0Y64_19100 [Myxococcaceae bacterium]|nr:hypothetical protein [Myxococcaceae bacterium]
MNPHAAGLYIPGAMRSLRALLVLPLLTVLACGDSSTKDDAGTPDSGAPDAGQPDAGGPDGGGPDAGPQACDAGALPPGVPQLTGRFFFADAGDVPFTPNGDTFVGTFGAVSADVYLAPQLAALVDAEASYIDGGTQWISIRADGGYAQAARVNLALKLKALGGSTVVFPFASEGYGGVQVGPGGQLTLTPACGEAPRATRFASPSADGGTQLLLQVTLNSGTSGAQDVDIVFELVPLPP